MILHSVYYEIFLRVPHPLVASSVVLPKIVLKQSHPTMGSIDHSSNDHRFLTHPIINHPKLLLSNYEHAKSESKSGKMTKKTCSYASSGSFKGRTIKNGRSCRAPNINIKEPHRVTKLFTDTTIKNSITNISAPKIYPRKIPPK